MLVVGASVGCEDDYRMGSSWLRNLLLDFCLSFEEKDGSSSRIEITEHGLDDRYVCVYVCVCVSIQQMCYEIERGWTRSAASREHSLDTVCCTNACKVSWRWCLYHSATAKSYRLCTSRGCARPIDAVDRTLHVV